MFDSDRNYSQIHLIDRAAKSTCHGMKACILLTINRCHSHNAKYASTYLIGFARVDYLHPAPLCIHVNVDLPRPASRCIHFQEYVLISYTFKTVL